MGILHNILKVDHLAMGLWSGNRWENMLMDAAHDADLPKHAVPHAVPVHLYALVLD